MQSRWPKTSETVAAAEDDVLAYMAFPPEHWTRIYSTNPLQRLNKEIKRRTKVVGSILMEAIDEWQVGRRYFSKASMRKLYERDEALVDEPAQLGLALVR